MTNQRRPTRSNFIGAYITDEVKERVVRNARARGLNVADYLRALVEEAPEPEEKSVGEEKPNAAHQHNPER